MPFGWGANPNLGWLLDLARERGMSPMPFGWGANPNRPLAAGHAGRRRSHQCLSAGGLIQTSAPHADGGHPAGRHQCLSAGGLIQTHAARETHDLAGEVTNAFRLGG